MSKEQDNKKPWAKWLAIVAIGLITISLISFTKISTLSSIALPYRSAK